MKPQEKAKELITKFNDDIAIGTNVEDIDVAKQCALIAVEEVIKSWEEDGNSRLDKNVIDWWKEVKQIIINEPGS